MAKKTDCEGEILELRKQMEEMAAKQAAQQKSENRSKNKDKTGVNDEAEEGESSLLTEKIEEFAELLQQDLKQIPTMTAIAIFALGVLMGRLMSK